MIDQLRVEGDIGGATSILSQVRERLAQSNLDGWLGHTYLLEASINLAQENSGDVQVALEKAMKSYRRTNHLWGRLQCDIIAFRLSILFGGAGNCSDSAADDLSDRLAAAGYWRDANAVAGLTGQSAKIVPAISCL